MSTSTQELTHFAEAVERRFYSRVAPRAPVYVDIDGNSSLLLNVSENGLLVSTPVALQCNFVARIGVPLPGLPKPVQVNVRVVWASEVRKLAGIQLLDLDDYDREQIRKWGTRESRQFLYEESEENHAAAIPSAGESETPVDTPVDTAVDAFKVDEPPPAEATEEEIPSSEERIVASPVPPVTPRSEYRSAPRPELRSAAGQAPRPSVRVPDSTVPEVATSPAARMALWVMGIAAIFLAAFFLLKTVSGISFAHSREIFHRSSPDASPPSENLEIPETPAPPFHANPPSLDPSYSYVAANAGPPPRTLDPAKSKHAASNASALADSTHTSENAGQTVRSSNDEKTPEEYSFNSASNQHDTAPAKSTSAANTSLPEKPFAPLSRPVANNRSESQNTLARNAVASGPVDSSVKSTPAPGSSVSTTAPGEAASKSATAFANSSPYTSTTPSATPGTPSASLNPPAANAAPPKPTRANNLPVSSATAPIYSRPSSAPNTTYLAPRNANSSVIQMDTPERQTMEIHPQSGYRGPFFELPGERVLESSSVTMRIQRSVRMPATHSLWPFNHNNKKVVIGGLMSRVDPQPAPNQIRSADIVRVVATVGEDGRIENVKPIHGSANLLPNVLKAVQQWRYQPTLIDGKPVETQCDVLFQFHAPADRRAQR